MSTSACDLYGQALLTGNIDEVKKILQLSTSDEYDDHLYFQTATPLQNTCLHLAVQSKDFLALKQILSRCPPRLLIQANLNGDSALHIAARMKNDVMVSVLLEHASTMSWYMQDSYTTLEQELVRMVNKNKNTPLHEALIGTVHGSSIATTDVEYNEWYSSCIIKVTRTILLADKGFKYVANSAGETPLYLAIQAGFHHDVILMLLSSCSSGYGGPHGTTALHAAAIYCSSSDIISSLLTGLPAMPGMPEIIKAADSYGRTALHYAAYHGNDSMVSKLIGIDHSIICVADNDGNTALHIAASMSDRVNVVKQLVECCPDCCKMQDNKERIFFHVAAENGVLNVFQYFLGADKRSRVPEHVFTQQMIQYLVNQGDNNGNTPLHLAASTPEICENVVQLLCSDERVNKTLMNKDKKTALDLVEEIMVLGFKHDGVFDDHLLQAHKYLKEASACRSYWPKQLIKDKALILLEKKLQCSYEAAGDEQVSFHEEANKVVGEKNYAAHRGINSVRGERSNGTRRQVQSSDKVAAVKSKSMEKVSDTHLVVAALIATVTFAAGFTPPGGYNSHGMAVLTRKPAFIAFVVSNTMAMILSTFAVLVHFLSKRIVVSSRYKDPRNHLMTVAFYSTFSAISAMVVAFVTGTYSVLSPAKLAISICVLGCGFYLLLGYLLYKVVQIMRSKSEDPSSLPELIRGFMEPSLY